MLSHFPWLVVLSTLLAVNAPSLFGVATFRINESKVPAEAAEEFQENLEEGVVTGQRRIRMTFGWQNLKSNVPQETHLNRLVRLNPSHCADGHRLLNDVLAPLTC